MGDIHNISRQLVSNEPPVEPGQIWVTKLNKPGARPMRRIRIIAEYPFRDVIFLDEKDRLWIYENLPGSALRMGIGEIGRCPEFNLRFIFELEGTHD